MADVLDLTISEAATLFEADREVLRAIAPISEVGLEYVKLGQPVPTLSGGEAQRVAIAPVGKDRRNTVNQAALTTGDRPNAMAGG